MPTILITTESGTHKVTTTVNLPAVNILSVDIADPQHMKNLSPILSINHSVKKPMAYGGDQRSIKMAVYPNITSSFQCMHSPLAAIESTESILALALETHISKQWSMTRYLIHSLCITLDGLNGQTNKKVYSEFKCYLYFD